jgi:Zn-dependent protease
LFVVPTLAIVPSFTKDPLGSALTIVLLILSLSVHEWAHARSAFAFGDTTARDEGRMTLNPIVHIDLFMTILVPIMTLMIGGFFFGGAKPVPVLMHRLRNPWRDMAIVALAGPVSNLVLAMLFFALFKTALYAGYPRDALLPRVMGFAVASNVLLFVFNLFPIPPLDGSRVMANLLPMDLRGPYLSISSWGLVIVLVAFQIPFMRDLLYSAWENVTNWVQVVVSLGGVW